MDVARHHALADLEQGRAAQRHVLADGRDRIRNRGLHGDVADPGRLDLLDVGADVERDLRDHLDEALELAVARDEVGLGIDLDDHTFGALGERSNQAFGGDAAALLGSLRQALLAQPVLGRRHVAAGLGQRRLAIHHARAGRLAQVLHHRSRDCRHWMRPFAFRVAAAARQGRHAALALTNSERSEAMAETAGHRVSSILLPRSAPWPGRPRHRRGSAVRHLRRSCAQCRDRVRRAANSGRYRAR